LAISRSSQAFAGRALARTQGASVALPTDAPEDAVEGASSVRVRHKLDIANPS